MKRAPELHDLSSDHHHGLALARMAKRVAAGDGDRSVADAWVEIGEKFRLELEPHFRIEEAALAPALEARGESALVRRLLEEHAALRALVATGPGGTTADLARFAELLEQHIRFEERELFDVAQRVLSARELGVVAEASRAKSGRMTNIPPAIVSPRKAAESLTELWSPRVIGEVDDAYIKVARVHGSLAWHSHENEDELFLILKGHLRIEMEDGAVELDEGDMFIVPKGVRHNPVAEGECHLLLVERKTTLHTGDVATEKTRSLADQLRPLPGE